VKWLPKFRFSMRTLFILVTLLCVLLVPLSVKVYKARQQRMAVESIRANGGKVLYVHDWASIHPRPAILDNRWLRSVLGDDFYDVVFIVRITDPSDADISQLSRLRSLLILDLKDPHNVDLSPLNRRSIGIHFSSETSFTEKNLAELSQSGCRFHVSISGPVIDDLSPIYKLSNISRLTIANSQVSDLAPLAKLVNLQFLNLNTPKASDLSPLFKLSNLETLTLKDMQVPEAEINKLEKALPNCKVHTK